MVLRAVAVIAAMVALAAVVAVAGRRDDGAARLATPASTPTPLPSRPPPLPGEPRCAVPPGPVGDFCYEQTQGSVLFAESTRARRGRFYPIAIGHCGLMWIVDFDGSFWRPLPPELGPGEEPPSFFINGDRGVIWLSGRDRAMYRSASEDADAELQRVGGPIAPAVCA